MTASLIEALARAMPKMPRGAPANTRFAKLLRDIETPPHLRQGPEQPINLNFKPIDQADVEHAVQELHAQREREKSAK